MRPVARLQRLKTSVEKQLERIEDAIDGVVAPAGVPADRLATYAVIHLDNVWSSFVRSYYLSWFLNPITIGGTRVRVSIPAPPSFHAAIVTASTILYSKLPQSRTKRIDPAWHEKRVLTTLARGCGTSNQAQIQTAMSIGGTSFDYLHTARNFYAHRCEETAEKLPRIALAFGLVPTRRASDIVLAVPLGRKATVIQEWVAEIRGATDLLCA